MKDPKGRGVAGFEKHIFVCENLREGGHPRGCCSEKGGKEIRMRFKQEIGKRDLIGKVRANKAGCLDFCEQGPTIVVYPEGTWYRISNPDKDIPAIVKGHCMEGEIVRKCEIRL